ncbi:MAG: hypothetical protein RR255_00325 [Bacilli bacterium]
MEELKLKEPTKVTIKGLEKEVTIKRYLLMEEINEIVETCKDLGIVTRDMLMYSLIIDKCTDLIGLIKTEEDTIAVDLEMYNLYKTNGIISEILSHIDETYIDDIEYYISKSSDINYLVKETTNKVEKCLESVGMLIDKVSEGDLDNFFVTTMNKIKTILWKK